MSCARETPLTLVVLIGAIFGSAAIACVPPERPYLPRSEADLQFYADLIGGDFEVYFAGMQEYFRCLDAERARAFVEAQEVSEEYGRLLRTVER